MKTKIHKDNLQIFVAQKVIDGETYTATPVHGEPDMLSIEVN